MVRVLDAPGDYGAYAPAVSTISSLTSKEFTSFTPGQTLYLSFFYSATRTTGSATDTITSYIYWYTAAHAFISSTSNVINVNGSTSNYVFRESPHTVPATASYGVCQIVLTPGLTTTQHSIYIAKIRLGRTQVGATLGADVNANIVDSSTGSTLNRTDLITSIGTAAAITGQGPFATFTDGTPEALWRDGTNLFPYPRGTEDGRTPAQLGWVNTSATAGFGALIRGSTPWIGGGYYQMSRTSSGAATDLFPAFDIPWPNGGGYSISTSLYGYCTNGTFMPYVEFRDAANTSVLGSASLVYNSTTDRWQVTTTTPTNTAFIRIVARGSFGAWSSGTQDVTFTTIKIERNTVSTAYSEPPDMLTRAGGYRRIGDQRNLPAITSMNLAYKVTKTSDGSTANLISYSSTYNTTFVTSTISIVAVTLLIGGVSVSYNAMTSASFNDAVNVNVTKHLYIDDPNYTGGTPSGGLIVVDNSTSNPIYQSDGRVYLGSITFLTPSSGTSGGSGGSGGGGACPTEDMLLLMADGSEKEAGDIKVGDLIRTRHEYTLEWGDFKVTHVEIALTEVCEREGWPTVSPHHLFYENDWFQAKDYGTLTKPRRVVKITVEDAHTYMLRHPASSQWRLSHNLKPL